MYARRMRSLWWLCVFSLSLLIAAPRSSRAEINMSESLELLVTKADWIVAGRITKLSPADPAARGKNSDLTLVIVQPTETVKAPTREAPRPAVCIGVRGFAAATLAEYQKQGTELLFFLEQTIQATSYEKVLCDLWPIRNQGSSQPYIVSLSNPGKQLLSATTFKVLKDRATILAACKDTMKRFPWPDKRKPDDGPQAVFLELPFESEAFQALYSGSACFLYVPEGMFPKAKRTLH